MCLSVPHHFNLVSQNFKQSITTLPVSILEWSDSYCITEILVLNILDTHCKSRGATFWVISKNLVLPPPSFEFATNWFLKVLWTPKILPPSICQSKNITLWAWALHLTFPDWQIDGGNFLGGLKQFQESVGDRMRYWKNNFTAPIEFKFFNSWAIKNQRYSEFVGKRYPSYDGFAQYPKLFYSSE